MRRLIPGKTKVQIELFKGITLTDIAVGAVFAAMLLFVVISSLPFKGYICLVLLFIATLLLARLDTQANYTYLLNILRHFSYKRRFARLYTDEMLKKRAAGELADHAVDVLFGEGASHAKSESKREEKARLKAEARVRKAEDKVLNDPDAPLEEKEAILARREAQEPSKDENKEEETVAPVQKKSKKEREAEEKAKKKQRKLEDQILKSKKVTQEEKDVFLRGRNGKSHHKAKNQTGADYRKATGFEAVIGYLYLTGNDSRIVELLGETNEN